MRSSPFTALELAPDPRYFPDLVVVLALLACRRATNAQSRRHPLAGRLAGPSRCDSRFGRVVFDQQPVFGATFLASWRDNPTGDT